MVVIAWNLWNIIIYRRYKERFDAAVQHLELFLSKVDTDPKYGVGISTVVCLIMGCIVAASVHDARNFVSLFGLLVFLALTWATSWKPREVKLRPVLFSLFVQFIFGFIAIRTSWGVLAMKYIGDGVVTLLGFTNVGSTFVFSWLTDDSLWSTPFRLENGGSYTLGPPFFFGVLPVVIFFSSLMSIGYYLRILPWCVQKVGRVLGFILGTSASESLSAAGNIFVGQVEAPLLIRPFMKDMTSSELHAIMTGGFATIAGTVFGIYVSFGIDPVAILAASIMSAPAALAISKIAYPETEKSKTATGHVDIPRSDDANAIHAAANGAMLGIQQMFNITGSLIAFLALLAMIDAILGYLGDRVHIELSFMIICSYLLWPIAWLMGVDVNDCKEVAIVLGYKVFANEFVAYQKLAFQFRSQISERSYYIASYALCGFSNVASIGVQLAGLSTLAPNQEKKLAKLVVSAMIAGNTACLMTACVAGIFYESK